MTKTEMKKAAQDVIVKRMALVGYSTDYDEYAEMVGDPELAEEIMKSQMDRVAKMFGYKEAWYA